MGEPSGQTRHIHTAPSLLERRRKASPREGPDILFLGKDGASHQLNSSHREEEDGGSSRIFSSGSEGPDIWVNWEQDTYNVVASELLSPIAHSSRSQSSPNSHFLNRTATTPTSLPCLPRADVESPQTHSSDHTFVPPLCRGVTHSASVKVLAFDRGATLHRQQTFTICLCMPMPPPNPNLNPNPKTPTL